MKPAKKKPVKKSNKTKSRSVAPLKKKATSEKSKRIPGAGKSVIAKEKSSDTATIKKIKAENLRLTGQLEQTTRQLEVEVALEKVRTRTMAMQKSEELKEVIQVVYEQFNHLNILIEHTGFIVDYKERDDMHIWLTDKYASPFQITIPYFDSPHWNSFIEAKEKGNSFFANQLTFDAKNKFYEDLFKLIPTLPEESKQLIFSQPGLAISTVLLENVGLYIENFSGIPFTDEENNTLMRFGNVFQQTYTRFLDLQKAEAQAREAQIEAGLERVRSKTMAMHNSQDVGNTVASLFDELVVLGLEKSARCGIGILDESNIMELWTASTNDNGQIILAIGHLDMTLHPLLKGVKKTWSSKKQSLTYELQGEDLLNYFNILNDYPDYHIYIDVKTLPEKIIHNSFYFTEGLIYCFTRNPISEDLANVVKRFSGVFGQTYKRYLDLRKAEAQAREAQIEAALERVRSRTIAMQRSEELADVATMLFKQIRELGIETWTTGFNVWLDDNTAYQDFVTNPEGGFIKPYSIDLTQYPVFIEIREAKLRGDDFFVRFEEGDTIKETYQLLMTYAPEQYGKLLQDGFQFPSKQYEHFVFGKTVSLMFITYKPVPEAHDIFKRFGKVFEQTYTRFLDLQRAEAQVREAQIEAALEKVRSRSLAMHKSEELSDVIKVVSDQLQYLKFRFDNVSFVLSSAAEDYDFWFSIPGQHEPHHIHVPYLDNPINNRAREARSKGLRFHEDVIDPAASSAWHQHMFDHNQMDFLSEEAKAIVLKGGFARSVAITPNIMLVVGNYASKPYGEEENAIIKRFAIVFEQSYTRFLDLQKAESQAREAQIEAALERVRSKTMAMHKSEQLSETAQVLFEQFSVLGKIPDRIAIGIIHEELKVIEWWVTDQSGGQVTSQFNGSILEPTHAKWVAAWKEGKDALVVDLSGEELNQWIAFVRDKVNMHIDDSMMKGRRIHHAAFFSQGLLLISAHEPMPNETMLLLLRFAKVFNQTYTRFLDLQKAEAQAREALIEASLERVRGKAMAMHSSEDLAATIGVFYRELESFSITPRRCGVGLLEKETRMAELSTMNTTEQGESIEVVGNLKMQGHPVLEGVFDNWILQREYHPVLRGNEIKEYYQLIRPQIAFPEYPNDAVQYGYFFYFMEGGVYAWTEKKMTEEELKIYRRFATVLSLTYKRYKDLKDAEVRERDAVKQAALDRVRADIASMRSTADLDRITPLIWKELTTLGISFIRCGVFIMDEKENKVHSYLSTPDGRAIAAFHTPFENSGGLVGAIESWRLQNVYVTHWEDKDFQTQAEILVSQGAIETKEQYLSTLPRGGFHLHFLPFVQGMLYVGSIVPLQQDDLHLVQSLAEAFSVAYARYEDFTKLEDAKKNIEVTLSDLRAAQSQLIQSEKMASLGELTAGIAHEIQNPLNFVNNFSEVSNELLEEMHDEIEKGNVDGAKAIAKDVKQNLEKILHHGKRADGIVKGMLQHSRTGSGQKEPTDINLLCEEYLRLAYHGLRAKDKSFNAKFETSFDETIGKIEVVPQDIGRVILNLINNAFYAVAEKSSAARATADKNYDPIVSVSTKNYNGKIMISVKDNGNGIPQRILDKIFQPFFTTKPAGQGTGLGLSLSYDIAKAHGGSIAVNSKEGEGSEFVIQLTV